jgi:hypothetical protein
LAAQAAAPAPLPAPEAIALGERLARSGTLAALLPIVVAKETDDLVRERPELTAAEQARLRAAAAATAKANIDRLMAAEGRAYAAALTPAELAALVAQAESPAGRRLQAVLPRVIAGTMASVGEVNFKGEALAAFCRAGRPASDLAADAARDDTRARVCPAR